MTRAFSLAAALLAALPAAAETGARALLTRALTPPAAAYALEYKILVYPKPKASGAKVRPVSQVRTARWSPPAERLLRMHRRRGAQAVFFETESAGVRTAAWPEKSAYWRFRVRAPSPSERAALLLSRFEISAGPGGRQASRPAERLDMREKGGRLRASWWIDRETGLVLRRDDYRPDGSLQRRERALSLTLAPVEAEASPAVPEGAGGLDAPFLKEHEGLPSPDASFGIRHPSWLPHGCVPFVAVASKDRRVVHVSYNDGAKAVTVAQGAPGALERPKSSPYARAALKGAAASLHEVPEGLAAVFSYRGRDYRVTGDLPEHELILTASSLTEGD
jgi:hypothetical protein